MVPQNSPDFFCLPAGEAGSHFHTYSSPSSSWVTLHPKIQHCLSDADNLSEKKVLLFDAQVPPGWKKPLQGSCMSGSFTLGWIHPWVDRRVKMEASLEPDSLCPWKNALFTSWLCNQSHTCTATRPSPTSSTTPCPALLSPSAPTHILEGVHGDNDLIGQRGAISFSLATKGDVAGEGGTGPGEKSRTANRLSERLWNFRKQLCRPPHLSHSLLWPLSFKEKLCTRGRMRRCRAPG